MSDESWTYRVRGTLTDEERAIVEDALQMLIEGKLVAYSMRVAGASVTVDCRSEHEAHADALRRFGDFARERGGKIKVQRSNAPSGRHDWFRPAGISQTIELRPGLIDWTSESWPHPSEYPAVELDPDQRVLL